MNTKKVKDKKIAAVKDIKEKIKNSKIMIITDHSGLKVVQMTSIRNKLWNVKAQYAVLKNTLVQKALTGDAQEKLKDLFNGPTSIIFGNDEIVGPAKIISDFIKENEKPIIKGAFMEGIFVEASSVKKIAALPSREILISMVLQGLNAPITSFVRVVKGPINKLVYALEEIKKKKGVI